MNCNKLKDKLGAKDAEIKARNENTIYYFNLIKGDVLDMFIDKAISSEFKEWGELLHKDKVIEIMAEKKEIDAGRPVGGFLLQNDFWNIENTWEKGSFLDGFEFIELSDVFGDVDYDKLKYLLSNHLLENGFSYKWITNLWGQRVKTRFFITSRKSLEKACCSNKVEIKKDEGFSSGEKLGLIAFILAIFAWFFIYVFIF